MALFMRHSACDIDAGQHNEHQSLNQTGENCKTHHRQWDKEWHQREQDCNDCILTEDVAEQTDGQ